jgi:streptomycin 6-kinase
LELDELETAPTDHWVHGTLHPGNLVLDMAGRLYAIDPRPFLADRQYDIAELALKVGSERAGRNHNIDDGLRLLDELAGEMSFDQVRAERWLRVIAASGV